MKILIVGAGSIGQRHIKNLKILGHQVYAVDLNKGNFKKASASLSGAFLDLETALKIKPEAAFICTFSNTHVRLAMECAKAGCHLFIEKPLSTDIKGVKTLINTVRSKGLLTMVGCNMRFHPAVAYMHDLSVNHPAFRKMVYADLEFGYYLPFAKKDYKKSYQARRKLGGDLIFDGIHELDYAVWFFGAPKRVFCTKGMVSGLKMDTEDHVEMIVEFKSGVVCSVHLDYLQHGYSRRCKLVSEEATAVWDFTGKKIGLITKKQEKWKWLKMDVELYYNKMYLDEAAYFLDSVKKRRKAMNSIEEALTVLNLGLAAQKSALTGKWEPVSGMIK